MTHGLSIQSKPHYARGQPVGGRWVQDGAEWSAELPHSCDEWVFGSGDRDTVVAALEQLRHELDGALAFLREQPEWPAQEGVGGWEPRGLSHRAIAGV